MNWAKKPGTIQMPCHICLCDEKLIKHPPGRCFCFIAVYAGKSFFMVFFPGLAGNSPMCISLVWHGTCNSMVVQIRTYEKDNCFKPGIDLIVLFPVTSIASFLSNE